jgi:hypothetical protein
VAAWADAAELRQIELVDALAIVELIRATGPERFDTAAVRWTRRLALGAQPAELLELPHAVRA